MLIVFGLMFQLIRNKQDVLTICTVNKEKGVNNIKVLWASKRNDNR